MQQHFLQRGEADVKTSQQRLHGSVTRAEFGSYDAYKMRGMKLVYLRLHPTRPRQWGSRKLVTLRPKVGKRTRLELVTARDLRRIFFTLGRLATDWYVFHLLCVLALALK